jgi:hypothetical protein
VVVYILHMNTPEMELMSVAAGYIHHMNILETAVQFVWGVDILHGNTQETAVQLQQDGMEISYVFKK